MKIQALSSRVKVSSHILFREMQGEAVLLNFETGVYFGLDSTGTRIWHLFEKKNRLEAVLDSLLHEYKVDAKNCREDLLNFTSSLAKNGLIEIHAE